MTATHVPTRWEMYTDKGDAKVTAEMVKLVLAVRRGNLTRATLPGAVAAAFARLKAVKVSEEVSDTEPKAHLLDFLNALCDEHGWVHVSRDVFWPAKNRTTPAAAKAAAAFKGAIR